VGLEGNLYLDPLPCSMKPCLGTSCVLTLIMHERTNVHGRFLHFKPCMTGCKDVKYCSQMYETEGQTRCS
jgi:hypothetical protein